MPLSLLPATDAKTWDTFLASRQYRPFLQSWTMGEVYRDIGQEPVRLALSDNGRITGICQAIVVPARRGKHLMVPYGPVLERMSDLPAVLAALKDVAMQHRCAFIRISPFLPTVTSVKMGWPPPESSSSPLHLLAEHLWYLPLETPDPWGETTGGILTRRTEQELLAGMRSTARNLIRRAQKEGVTVQASDDPVRDLPEFLRLHEETRKRHKFVPYGDAFFRAQVGHFAPRGEVLLYLARYNGEVIASSIHMRFGGETSYHHGASTFKYKNVPASYLLQWTAIADALRRGDRVYNFWGISPEGVTKHPFAGVRTFKTGFGGTMRELVHCTDIPLTKKYWITWAIETGRKWKRGF